MKVEFKDKVIEIEESKKICELFENEIKENENTVVGAICNNGYVNLEYNIEKDSKIELLDTSKKEGMKIYRRTLVYIFAKALRKLYPENSATINYQLANSTYCDLGDIEATEEVVERIKEEMREIVRNKLPIKEVVMNREEAKKFYEETKTLRGKLQYDFEDNQEIHMYFCEDYFNYSYGVMANNTGDIRIFDIMKYDKGILLRYPSIGNPNQMPKLMQNKKIRWALNEYNDIHKILNVNTIYKLNNAVEENKIKDVIMLDEALHEKKIANIADKIAKNRNIKMILIAGPSSSGKTTFAQRLGIQLKINKLNPVTISVDNYFVERKDNPKDADGNYNFECIEAIDLKLFNDHLTRLLKGEEVEMPQFDFIEGTKRYNGNKIKMKEDDVLVIEGIHCLNDRLTSSIPQDEKFKVYISALTVLNIDRYAKVSSSDTRLIRRMVRDYQFRGYSAKDTIKTWPKVGKGEVENIFPFQEDADVIFNTSLIYELGVLKPIAEEILGKITNEDKEYAEAKRLLNILKYVKTIDEKLVPTNSLLKEFVGGGDFKY